MIYFAITMLLLLWWLVEEVANAPLLDDDEHD